MKIFVIILIAILIFLGCAMVGYQLASMRLAPQITSTGGGIDYLGGEQHNLMIMHVDRLDAAQPRLISIWFVSLYFLNDYPLTLTAAQIYPPSTPTPSSRALERTFNLSASGEPVSAFWNAVGAYKIQWEGYILIDNVGLGGMLDGLFAPGDYREVLAAARADQAISRRLIEQVCSIIGGASNQDIGTFDWPVLAAQHFRTNLQIDIGLAYWSRITSAKQPVRCEVIMAP